MDLMRPDASQTCGLVSLIPSTNVQAKIQLGWWEGVYVGLVLLVGFGMISSLCCTMEIYCMLKLLNKLAIMQLVSQVEPEDKELEVLETTKMIKLITIMIGKSNQLFICQFYSKLITLL